MVSLLKGEQENLRVETLNNLTSVQQVTQAQVATKPSEVTLEDMNTMKRMFFEMKDNVKETDNFVRQNLLTKVELLSTGIEDVNIVVKNLGNKYNSYKSTFDQLDANIREQLDIIQSLNGKINANYENQQKFKQDIFDRFVALSEEVLSAQVKEDSEKQKKLLDLTERFEKSMSESVEEILQFRKEFQFYKETKENEIAELDLKYGVVIKETSKSVADFQETITINVGSMLKDITDIKLQLTGGFGGSGSGEGVGVANQALGNLEIQVQNIKEQLRVLQEDFEQVSGKGKKAAGLEEEVTNIWSFLQRYADEHAQDKIEIIKNQRESFDNKIEVLGWLARYSEFVTVPMITQVIVTFKELLIPNANPTVRNNYIQAKHSSHAVLNIVKMVQVLKYKFSEEDGKQKLAVMLSILEPAIVNDENVTIAVHLDLVEILQDFMLFTLEEFENRSIKKTETPKSIKPTKGAKAPEPQPAIDLANNAPLYLKLLIRCLTSCLRLDVGV